MNFLMKLGLLCETPTWIENIKVGVSSIVDALLWPILFIVATVGIIYSIILGVNYSKAETSEKKEEAKKRIINAIIGIVIMIVLIILLKIFVNNIDAVADWVGSMAG